MAERIFDNFKKMNNDLYKESLERMGIGLEETSEEEWELGKEPVRGKLVLSNSEYLALKQWFEGHSFPALNPIMKILADSKKMGNKYVFEIPNEKGWHTGKNFVNSAMEEVQRIGHPIAEKIADKLYNLLEQNVKESSMEINDPEQLQEMKLPNYNEFEFEYQEIMGKGNKK